MTTLQHVHARVQPASRRDLSWVAIASPATTLPFAVGKPARPRAPKGGVTVAGRYYRGGSYLPASVATEPCPYEAKREAPCFLRHCDPALWCARCVADRGGLAVATPARVEGPAWTWDAWTDADTWELGPDRDPEDTTDHAVAFAPTRREEMYKLGYELGLDRDDATPLDATDAADLDAFREGWRDGKAEWDRRLDEMCGSPEYAEFSARVSDFDIYAPGAVS